MKDYAIWCAEKIQERTGWDFDTCMNYVVCDRSLLSKELRDLFEEGGELSMSNYIKEVGK